MGELETLRKKTLEAENAASKEELRARIRKLLDSDSNAANIDDINRFLLISQDKNDLDLTLEAFKRYQKLVLVDENQRFGEKFIKMCFLLNVPEKLTELVETDKVKRNTI